MNTIYFSGEASSHEAYNLAAAPLFRAARSSHLAEIGGLSLGALSAGSAPTLAQVLRAEESVAAPRDFSVILFWANGGPSHLETFDLKPAVPQIRGPFRPIRTNVPGFDICELSAAWPPWRTGSPSCAACITNAASIPAAPPIPDRALLVGGQPRPFGKPRNRLDRRQAPGSRLAPVRIRWAHFDHRVFAAAGIFGNTQFYGGGPAIWGRPTLRSCRMRTTRPPRAATTPTIRSPYTQRKTAPKRSKAGRRQYLAFAAARQLLSHLDGFRARRIKAACWIRGIAISAGPWKSSPAVSARCLRSDPEPRYLRRRCLPRAHWGKSL